MWLKKGTFCVFVRVVKKREFWLVVRMVKKNQC